MYVGRIIIVGKTDKPFVAYRVSSRSFPDRMVHLENQTASIKFKPGFEPGPGSQNPFTTYNCIMLAGEIPIVSNGTHTDLIAEKISSGMDPEKAIHDSLEEMGYEKDELNTPRIAGAFSGNTGYLGIVDTSSTHTTSFELMDNTCRAIATYGLDLEAEYPITASTIGQISHFAYNKGDFASLEMPICSAAFDGEFGIYNPMTLNEAKKILTENVDEGVVSHSKKVMEVAERLANGKAADIELVKIGALLHDIGRSATHKIAHVTEGVKFAKAHDFSTELVSIIHNHIGAGANPEEAKQLGLPPEDFTPKTLEEKIVSYADLMVFGNEEVGFEEAMKRYSSKYPNSPYLEKIKKLHDEIQQA